MKVWCRPPDPVGVRETPVLELEWSSSREEENLETCGCDER